MLPKPLPGDNLNDVNKVGATELHPLSEPLGCRGWAFWPPRLSQLAITTFMCLFPASLPSLPCNISPLGQRPPLYPTSPSTAPSTLYILTSPKEMTGFFACLWKNAPYLRKLSAATPKRYEMQYCLQCGISPLKMNRRVQVSCGSRLSNENISDNKCKTCLLLLKEEVT